MKNIDDIIEALRSCSGSNFGSCERCPYYSKDPRKDCVSESCHDAINLITQQQAELAELKKDLLIRVDRDKLEEMVQKSMDQMREEIKRRRMAVEKV